MSKQYIYADGVESITMLEGMVRLDFFCCDGKNAQGKIQRETTTQIVIPPAAFLQAYEAMGKMVRHMEEGGFVLRKAVPAPGAAAQPAKPAVNSSPNFD